MDAKYVRARSDEHFGGQSESDYDESTYPMMPADSDFVSSFDDQESVRIYPDSLHETSNNKDRWKLRCLAIIFCCVVPLVLLLALIFAASLHAFG